ASVLVRCDRASRVGQSIARSIGRLCLAWWSAGGRGYQPRTEHICLSRERVGGEVLLCFFKAEQCKFSDIYGLYRGARTCLLAGSGGRSPTAMLLEPGAKAAFLHIPLDLLTRFAKQQIRRAASNIV